MHANLYPYTNACQHVSERGRAGLLLSGIVIWLEESCLMQKGRRFSHLYVCAPFCLSVYIRACPPACKGDLKGIRERISNDQNPSTLIQLVDELQEGLTLLQLPGSLIYPTHISIHLQHKRRKIHQFRIHCQHLRIPREHVKLKNGQLSA